jgi:hypothetical protein
MNLDEIQPTSPECFGADAAEVAAAERALGLRFPTGYADVITRFGQGVLCGYIRVYPPGEIVAGENSHLAWRERIGEYWFWDEGVDVLSKERALECVLVADTLNGDELVFHPSAPERVFILPRSEEMIYAFDGGLFPALDWLLNAGVLAEPVEDRTFEPFDGSGSAEE